MASGLLSVVLLVSCVVASEDNIVVTKYGKVQGVEVVAGTGKKTYSYLGIPYAEAPLGNLRFKPPKEILPWDGILRADKKMNACFQVIEKQFIKKNVDWFIDQTNVQSEDCLYLNVWTPSPRPSKSAVMVWLYPGGYATGSCSMDKYDGRILASENDVIVVCLNYRLGFFGFLYLNSTTAPGNVGLMDQTLALKWVHQNIEAFGGDPYRITIFGESAGSSSVEHHLLLESSRGLFQRAIMMSGSDFTYYHRSSTDFALNRAKNFLSENGCANKQGDFCSLQDSEDVILRTEGYKLMENYQRLATGALFEFTPVIDGSFITKEKKELIKDQLDKDIDIMVGYTKDEGTFVLGIIFPLFLVDDLQEDFFTGLVQGMTQLQNNETLNLIKFLYNKWKIEPNSGDKIEQMVRFLTDFCMICGTYRLIDHVTTNGNKLYWYEFHHVPYNRDEKWYGSTHGDDIDFLFGKPLANIEDFHPEEVELSRNVMDLFTSFAKHGKPEASSQANWPVCDRDRKQFYRLGLNMEAQKPTRTQQCEFWNDVFPQLKKLVEEL